MAALKKRKPKKKDGQIFTPNELVKIILDEVGYNDTLCDLYLYDIIDNSCGDGAFLTEIVRRVVKSAQANGLSNEDIIKMLEKKIHGIELDKELCERCVKNLNDVVSSLIPNNGEIKWDILNSDALPVHDYDGKMDFVVGNPPYVRVHNLGEELKVLRDNELTKKGNTDLYISFYELGLRMLKPTGTLGYVTPNSWLTSFSGQELRKRILEDRMLKTIIDFGHYQWFDGVCVYSTVAVLCKNTDACHYFSWEQVQDGKYWMYPVDKFDNAAPEYNINGKFYFGTKEQLNTLREIKTSTVEPYFKVKNGIATLADEIFINHQFGDKFGSPFFRPIVKASSNDACYCIYPYDKDGKAYSLDEIKENDILLYYYLMANKERLEKRTTQKGSNWYEYGRSQGIKDTEKSKVSVNVLVRDTDSVKALTLMNEPCCVYSGLYIIANEEPLRYWGNTILHHAYLMLKDNAFIEYVKMLHKYKSGGYYTFSSKDLEEYLNYTFETKELEKYQHLKEHFNKAKSKDNG